MKTILDTPPRRPVRPPEPLADTPRRGEPGGRPRKPSQVPAPDRLRAKDVAQLEGCSLSTAYGLIRSGELGPISGRNRRDRWVDRQAYQAWIDHQEASPPPAA